MPNKSNSFLLATIILWTSHGLGGEIKFSSGSDGSMGELVVGVDGARVIKNDVAESVPVPLEMPWDGVFKYSKVTVESGGRLTFKRNSLNTPVYLLSVDTMRIDGIVDVSAAGISGGPGGFDGGARGSQDLPPGDGHGPGGGKANATGGGWGAYGNRASFDSPVNGTAYGNALLVPLVGGSGGGGSNDGPGVGGGGAILLASDKEVDINGRVIARGQWTYCLWFDGNGGRGSGGAIRIVSPVVMGTGELDAAGGFQAGYWPNCGPGAWAGGGRIRIDAFDTRSIQLAFDTSKLDDPRVSAGAYTVFNGGKSLGSLMYVFPPNLPMLSILEIGDFGIPEDTQTGVTVMLPCGTACTQDVTIQGKNFTDRVQIEISVAPERGSTTSVLRELDFTGVELGRPVRATFPVDFPINIQTRLYVWTKP